MTPLTYANDLIALPFLLDKKKGKMKKYQSESPFDDPNFRKCPPAPACKEKTRLSKEMVHRLINYRHS